MSLEDNRNIGGNDCVASCNAGQGLGGGTAAPSSTPSTAPPSSIRGAYLWGPVGCGKTLLMDLFFASTRDALARLQQLQPQQQRQHQQPVPERTGSPAGSAGLLQGQACGEAPTRMHGSRGAAGQRSVPTRNGDSAAEGRGPGQAQFAAPHRPEVRSALRTHFHEFMQDVHSRLHALQQARPRVVGRSRQGLLVYRYEEPEEDPLLTVAGEWGRRASVLCLDELHVTDVADAMILSRLFGALLSQHPTALLFTANRPPRELYKGGLSRKYFEPFVRLVEEQMVVLPLGAGVDYRRAGASQLTPFAEPASKPSDYAAAAAESSVDAGLSPAPVASDKDEQATQQGSWYAGPDSEKRLRCAWEQRLLASRRCVDAVGTVSSSTGAHGGGSVEVPLMYGRTLKVPCADQDAVFLTFDQVCGSRGLCTGMDDGGALAAPDYLALCRRFRTLYVAGAPRLGPAQRDEARRLVTLVDIAYDNRCRLEVAAAVQPDELFADLLEEAARQGVNPSLGLPKASYDSDDAAAGTTKHSSSLGLAALPQPGAPLRTQIRAQPQPNSQQQQAPTDLVVTRVVLAEEVLMYHRAVSRLMEMCRLVGTGP